MITTKVYANNQTAIPSEFRKKFNIIPDDIVEWIEDENGEIKVNFRKKSGLTSIVGIVSSKKAIDSVKLQKQLDRGEKLDIDRQ
ncbi:MAG: AbrB/MazE/SpoVT family DNA-binding domain-containing protein [Methanobrevibacter sp.]|nr:AbrB/MazE/SpoVT family DNA-binding domain-containing protein [Methanobrevibacter sp.]